MPDGYGVPETVKGTLPWRYVDERMLEAKNYWVATVRPDGRPHAMPVWGAWIDGRLYIEGSPDTVRHRNIVGNPNVVVHLENGSEVVIVEGLAREAGKPDRALGEAMSQQMIAKYAEMGYSPGPDAWDEGGLYVIEPRKVFAWTKFPGDVTRFKIGG
jgi:hypothetical protein